MKKRKKKIRHKSREKRIEKKKGRKTPVDNGSDGKRSGAFSELNRIRSWLDQKSYARSYKGGRQGARASRRRRRLNEMQFCRVVNRTRAGSFVACKNQINGSTHCCRTVLHQASKPLDPVSLRRDQRFHTMQRIRSSQFSRHASPHLFKIRANYG